MYAQEENQDTAEFLLTHTHASKEVIERFVDLYWQNDLSNEENLEQFKVYHNELQAVFSCQNDEM